MSTNSTQKEEFVHFAVVLLIVFESRAQTSKSNIRERQQTLQSNSHHFQNVCASAATTFGNVLF